MGYIKYRVIFSFLILVVGAPLLLITNDFWDGSLVSYAFRIGDLSGIKVTYFESGWYLQYFLYEAAFGFASFLGISPEIVIKILTVLSLVGISIEVKRLSTYLLKLPEDMSYIAAYFVLLFPAWFVLVSNALVIHVICIYFVLFGYRLVMVKRQYVFGVLLMLLSFQLASNFMFALGLITSDYILRKEREENANLIYLLVSIMVIFSLFVLNRAFLGPSGEYETYNAFRFNLSMLRPFVGASVYFGIFIVTLIVIPLMFFTAKFNKAFQKNDLTKYSALILLIIAAIFPYISLGKSPGFFDFYNWDYRQAFLLSVPLPMLIAFLFHRVSSAVSSVTTMKFGYLRITLTLILFVSFLYVGFSYKYVSEYQRNAIVHSLKKINQPPSGILGFNITSAETDYLLKIRPYEYNTLLQRAYGRAHWMVSNIKINDTKDIFVLKEWQKLALSADVHQIKVGARYAHQYCRTLLELKQNRSIGFMDIVTNSLDNIYTVQLKSSEGPECLVVGDS